MTARSLLLACCCLLPLLAGCGPSATSFTTVYVGGGALAMPPLNTILFGPCHEEFGMDDARKANCELYYRVRGEEAPWVARQKYLDATAYQPGELSCTRTRGKIVECSVVSGPPHSPPYIVAPNNLGTN